MQEKTAGGTPSAPIKLDVSVRVIEPVKNLMGFASVKFNAVSYTHLASALPCAGAVGRGCQHRAGAGAGKDCGRHPLLSLIHI